MSPFSHPKRIAAQALKTAGLDAGSQPAQVLQGLADELGRWMGYGLTPQRGCGLREMTLGDATVTVEYEYEPGGGDGWNEPRYDAEVNILNVLINGQMCDAEDCVPSGVIERWEQELLEAIPEQAEAELAEFQIAQREDAREAA